MKKPRKKAIKPPKPEEPERFSCGFCDRQFAFEKTLIAHMCPSKSRVIDRNLVSTRIGFAAFSRFREYTYHAATTHDVFEKSRLYGAFIRFGKYMTELASDNAMDYVNYLLKLSIPIDKWNRDPTYMAFMREKARNETSERAVERSLMVMQQWSATTGLPWKEFFNLISPAQACEWIRSGKISPWVLFNSDTGLELLGRMSPEQEEIIMKAVDIDYWTIKFRRNQVASDNIRETFREAGL